MSKAMFRFITPHRTGKWYADLATAQRQAMAIGAGFYEPRSGQFIQYPGTRLEQCESKLTRNHGGKPQH